MIRWGDIYNVVAAMVPLYVALGLGYGSVRWWRIISPEQCEAINRLVSCITLPLFTFQFTLRIDPFAMNYRVIAADAISKAALPQSITSFIFAREYGLHADVLSTAVIFGMLVSLPVLVAYYVVLGLMS